MTDLPYLGPAIAGVFGLAVGSFLNVVIYRLPRMMDRDWRQQAREVLAGEPAAGADAEPATYNLAVPPSACPACGARIRAWQNIPVISWLVLRGRCANCAESISPRYPAVELLTGLLSAVIVWKFGIGIEAGGALVLTWSLIALTGIDIDRQLLPDQVTVPLLWLGLFLSVIAPPVEGSSLYPAPADAIIGAVAGYLTLWSVYWLFRLVTGKEGMGYGDFKLFAALGAWLGWQMLPLIILLSALVGSVVGIGLIVFARHGRHIPIPFGPYLAAAGLVAMLWGQDIVAAYLGAL